MMLNHTAETAKVSGGVEIVVTKAVGPLKQKNTARNFEMMLTVFDIRKKYPQKLTLLEALEVNEVCIGNSNICTDRKSYPFIIIQKILSFDHRCYTRLAKSAFQNLELINQQLRMVDFVSSEGEKLVPNINPLDGVITVLLCSDNFLRQDLMCRLATCQIAIPLVLPDPIKGTLMLTLWSLRTIVKQWEFSSTKATDSYGQEVSIISYPTPVISFLRIGTHQKSKSRLMNIVMNDSNHDTFFHYNSDGGS